MESGVELGNRHHDRDAAGALGGWRTRAASDERVREAAARPPARGDGGLRRARRAAGRGDGARAARRGARRRDRLARARRARADAARHDLSHHLDDEADHGRRGADPRRGVPAAARRSGRPVGCRSSRTGACCAAPDGPLDDTVPAERPISLRDLLTFRLGTRDDRAPRAVADPGRGARARHPGLRAARRRVPHGPDEWMRRLGTLPLMHQPGSGGSTASAPTCSAC